MKHCLFVTTLFLTIISIFCEAPTTQDHRVTVLCVHGLSGSGHRASLPYTRGSHASLTFYHGPQSNALDTRFLFDIAWHKVFSFDFQDVMINMGMHGSIPHPYKTDIGQQADIARLRSALEQLNNNSCTLIGFGYSRGAATWLTTVGTDRRFDRCLRALILEAPFAHMHDVTLFSYISQALAYLKQHLPLLGTYLIPEQLFNIMFREHNFHEIQPIIAAQSIPKSLPILLIHSHEDTIIPISNSRAIYYALRISGHENVYLLELQHGYHAQALWGESGDEYMRVTHSFFKQYNLPYDPAYATLNTLAAYQPSFDNIPVNTRNPG